MDYDADKVDEAVLALLYLNSFKDSVATRAWRSFDWDSLDRLYARGLIGNPKSKAKSVVLTEQGARLAKDMFEKHFGNAVERE